MSFLNVGKILFVDDKYDNTIQQAVISLIGKGMPVQFWDGRGNFPETIQNVRVVILDLDLAGLGTRIGPEYYLSAVQALHKIPGPYIVIIMSIDFQKDDPSNLELYYKEKNGCPICGSVAKDGLTKAEEMEDPSRLEKIILSCIKDYTLLNFILLWESVVNEAKDRALSDLITKEVEDAILALTQLFKKDFGDEGVTREIINMMMRCVLRRTSEGEVFERFKEFCNGITLAISTDYPSPGDKLLFNKIMFYEPNTNEKIFTGDIFKPLSSRAYLRRSSSPIEKKKPDTFAIILTPMCDIIQGKTKKMLVCFAFPVHEKYFDDPDYLPYKIDSAVIKRKEEGMSQIQLNTFLKDRYLEKTSLPDNLYILWNFKYKDDILGICFDFHNVHSVNITDINKWERICRLDSPFIGEMVEKYSGLISRVGTLDINRSPSKIRKSIEEFIK